METEKNIKVTEKQISDIKFDFGENWGNFSKEKIDEARFKYAVESVLRFFSKEGVAGKDIIDIGCGSGLFSCAFSFLGGNVTGIDINSKCIEVSRQNASTILSQQENKPIFKLLSIIDCTNYTHLDKYDIVYSWGVLHHTGKMYDAIESAIKLVRSGGVFMVSIYNKHWSSPLWEKIKKIYNISPSFFKKAIIWFFYIVIVLAKSIVTCKNPFVMERGMDFYYNVVDWVGGYPYEYASAEEIETFMKSRGFRLLRFEAAKVPTGCNEFFFEKKKA